MQHVFPWDYKTTEFGFQKMSLTTAFINFFAKLGWAYDMKTVSEEIIKMRVKRTGDETCRKEINNNWGSKSEKR